MPKQAQPQKLESLLNMKLKDFLPMFHKALQQSHYCGLPILKNPLDLFIYQEIIYRTKPDIIIEIGTYKGGSAKYLRNLLTAIHGQERFATIITIDPGNHNTMNYDGISYLKGKATDEKVISDLDYLIKNGWRLGHFLKHDNPKIMVIDDGSHTYADTLANLNIYSQFITLDQYYIVEDTICYHGLNTGPKPGPAEAVDEFLNYCGRFLVDRTCERFGITYNSGGYLKCIKAA
ncbi:MAG: CmcI family methyltransferase [Candidatus Thorarchaeota archaeon]